MYEGRKRDGKVCPRGERIRPAAGEGGGRGSRECEEAMATSPAGPKKRVARVRQGDTAVGGTHRSAEGVEVNYLFRFV